MKRMLPASVSLVLAVSAALVNVRPVLGHCPGGTPDPDWRAYASGGYGIASGTLANAIVGTIQWTNPNPCTTTRGDAFTLEGINISQSGANNGWVQVGWVDRQGYSAPKWYCEFTGESPGRWDLLEGTLGSGTYVYKMQYDSADGYWDCIVNGSGKASRTGSWMGFTSGSWLVVQGETNATHGQIGKVAPSKLLFSDLQKRRGTTWSALNISVNNPPAPYGVDEPAAGQLRNWTNGH